MANRDPFVTAKIAIRKLFQLSTEGNKASRITKFRCMLWVIEECTDFTKLLLSMVDSHIENLRENLQLETALGADLLEEQGRILKVLTLLEQVEYLDSSSVSREASEIHDAYLEERRTLEAIHAKK